MKDDTSPELSRLWLTIVLAVPLDGDPQMGIKGEMDDKWGSEVREVWEVWVAGMQSRESRKFEVVLKRGWDQGEFVGVMDSMDKMDGLCFLSIPDKQRLRFGGGTNGVDVFSPISDGTHYVAQRVALLMRRYAAVARITRMGFCETTSV